MFCGAWVNFMLACLCLKKICTNEKMRQNDTFPLCGVEVRGAQWPLSSLLFTINGDGRLEIYSYGDFQRLQCLRIGYGWKFWFSGALGSLLLSKIGQSFLLSVHKVRKKQQANMIQRCPKALWTTQFELAQNIYTNVQFFTSKETRFD